jgi:acetylornithine deacetylase/succinyl-diaminopimelate desuccinylase-like protein
VAFGIGMPGVDVRMHGANERYPVEDLVTSVEIFAQAIAQLCQ